MNTSNTIVVHASPEFKVSDLAVPISLANMIDPYLLAFEGPGFAPQYSTPQAACADIRAYLPADAVIIMFPGDIYKIPTGLFISKAADVHLKLYSRSGLASKGIRLANSVGVIDSDYRDEILVMLENASSESFTVTHGMKIAQVEFCFNTRVDFRMGGVYFDQYADARERQGGFGSTGL